ATIGCASSAFRFRRNWSRDLGARGPARRNTGVASMKTALSAEAAAALIPDGAVCLIGGFMGVGSPHRLIDAMVKRGVKNLTIVANDTASPGKGIGKLISAGAVSKAIVSHIG